MNSVLLPMSSCGIMLTYRCLCACRHCLYACGPKWRDWLEPGALVSLLDDIGRLWSGPGIPRPMNPMFQGVHLAGGEPFLRLELLARAVGATVERGLYLDYVETSAAWCTDAAAAVEAFRQLKKAGLGRLLISCDPFHAEKMPPSRTSAAVAAALEVFGRGGTIVYQPEFMGLIAELGGGGPVPLERWVERYGPAGARRLFWEGCGLIPGGRAGFALRDYATLVSPERFEGESCRGELLESRHVHFDPRGNYIPSFCGGLSLGRVDGLLKFYDSFDLDILPVVKLLAEEGPWGLASWVRERHGWEPRSGYAGKCHLCADARRALAEAEPGRPELAPAEFYRGLD